MCIAQQRVPRLVRVTLPSMWCALRQVGWQRQRCTHCGMAESHLSPECFQLEKLRPAGSFPNRTGTSHGIVLMRLHSIAIGVAVAVGVASATECQLTTTTEFMKKIDKNASVTKCGAAAGFSLNPPPAEPTQAQLDKLCTVAACRPAISFLASLDIPSCTISMMNGINMRDITDSIARNCDSKRLSKVAVTVLSDKATAGQSIQPNLKPETAPSTESSGPSPSKPKAPTPSSSAPINKASLRKSCE